MTPASGVTSGLHVTSWHQLAGGGGGDCCDAGPSGRGSVSIHHRRHRRECHRISHWFGIMQGAQCTRTMVHWVLQRGKTTDPKSAENSDSGLIGIRNWRWSSSYESDVRSLGWGGLGTRFWEKYTFDIRHKFPRKGHFCYRIKYRVSMRGKRVCCREREKQMIAITVISIDTKYNTILNKTDMQ